MRRGARRSGTRPARRAARAVLAGLVAVASGIAVAPVPHAGASAPQPVCDRIAHVGDSLTVRMSALLPGAYARHGWKDPIIDAFGGRGVARRMYDDITGLQAVADIQATGFTGCWVIALGTNDTAHIADDGGSPEAQHLRRRQIIESMMDLIGPSPVLWVDVYLVADDDAYSAASAADWNVALAEERADHPNMSVFDWAPIARRHPSWMSADRIHDTPLGSIGRARLVTDAAAAVFGPGGSGSTDDVVATGVGDGGGDVASLAPPPMAGDLPAPDASAHGPADPPGPTRRAALRRC